MSWRDIPGISGVDKALAKILGPIKETLERMTGQRGDWRDEVVTKGELIQSGLAKYRDANGKFIQSQRPSGNLHPAIDGQSVFDVPPAVTNLVAVGVFGGIILTWTAPTFSYVARYNIYRADVDDIGLAVRIGSSPVASYMDTLGEGTGPDPKYYWVRIESVVGKEGPFNQTIGVMGQTAYTPTYLLSVLTRKWESNFDYAVDDLVIPSPAKETGFWYKVITDTGSSGTTEPVWPTTLGGTVVDGGLTWEAIAQPSELPPFLVGEVNGQPAVIINTAYIGDATIKNAAIESLAANKITVGNLVAAISIVGGLIKTTNGSGWRTEIDESFPFWYGTGTKNATNGRVYVDASGNFVLKDAAGNVAFSVNAGGYLNRANGAAIFMETWESSDALDDWQVMEGTGEVSIVSVADSQTGGKILRVGNNSSPDRVRLAHRHLIPFNPNTLYKLMVRWRETSGTGGPLSFGWLGIAADGVTVVNAIGGTTVTTSQQMHGASGETVGTSWVEHVGYTLGFGSPNGSTSAGTLASPGLMHEDVRYVRPYIMLNQTGLGIAEVDVLSIGEVARGATSADVPQHFTKTAVENIVGISDAGAIRNANWSTTKKISLDFASQLLAIGDDSWVSANAKILLDYNGGSPRAYIGDGGNKFLQFDGTDVSVGRDTKIIGADAYNNNSIYFHTFFESLDGYSTAASGSGSVAHGSSKDRVRISLDCNINGNQSSLALTRVFNVATFTWANVRRFKVPVYINLQQTGLSLTVAIGVVTNSVGFQFVQGSGVRGFSKDASSTSYTGYTAYSTGTVYRLEAVFLPGVSVTFYVNGSSIGSVSANLPTGTADAANFINVIATQSVGAPGGYTEIDISELIFNQE